MFVLIHFLENFLWVSISVKVRLSSILTCVGGRLPVWKSAILVSLLVNRSGVLYFEGWQVGWIVLLLIGSAVSVSNAFCILTAVGQETCLQALWSTHIGTWRWGIHCSLFVVKWPILSVSHVLCCYHPFLQIVLLWIPVVRSHRVGNDWIEVWILLSFVRLETCVPLFEWGWVRFRAPLGSCHSLIIQMISSSVDVTVPWLWVWDLLPIRWRIRESVSILKLTGSS